MIIATTLHADNLRATNLFSNTEWVPPRSEIKPEQLNAINVTFTDDSITTMQDAFEEIAKPKISYRCKNCNGHINPKTLKCEYCDTQY